MVDRHDCTTVREFEDARQRVTRLHETAIVGRPQLLPPSGQPIPPAWLAFIEGRYVGAGKAEAILNRALSDPDFEFDELGPVTRAAHQECLRTGAALTLQYLLLSALRHGQSLAVRMLAARGVTYESVLSVWSPEATPVFPGLPGQPSGKGISITAVPASPDLRTVMEAMRAEGGEHPRISHLFVALLERSQPVRDLLSIVLANQGLPPGQALAELEREIRTLAEQEREIS